MSKGPRQQPPKKSAYKKPAPHKPAPDKTGLSAEHAPAGFAEAQAGFLDAAPAQTAARDRFNESVALLRAFNLIDCNKARGDVIALARRLAKLRDGD